VVPLVAVHMFVFYFGLMADVTPPVGLASFAAAAISRADPIKTGITAFWYSSRTLILPFMFIFNPQLLMIGVHSWPELVLVVTSAITAMLLFAAGTQGWFLTRSRWYESALLLLVTFTLLRPGFWLDMVLPRYDVAPPQQLTALAEHALPGSGLRVRVDGTNVEGKRVHKTVFLPLGDEGSGGQRIAQSGLSTMASPAGVQVMGVKLRSPADKAGLEQGLIVSGIETERPRLAKEWLYLPALLLMAGVMLLQRRRKGTRAILATISTA
jgi:TRAP-type uncharacterized transport system fused permease subunit